MRVLVVDDEPTIRMTIAVALEGFDVLEAGDGIEALDILVRDTVDLLVVDVGLPDMSGFDLLANVRGRAATADLPVVILTAHGRESDHVRGYEAGVDAYVTKPFDFDELVEVVELLCSLTAEQRREHRARELSRAQTLYSIETLLRELS
jgi:DNA-binding response OmpR family regulator